MNLGFFRTISDIDESQPEDQQVSVTVPSRTEDTSRADSTDPESIDENALSGDHYQPTTTLS
ncbi:hypothetical protein H4R20_000884 [Coemansia guatemalensis]|uniref:Uncharacterized protein n=1 Tax=Coemansia guatemalensis TaxID=2761395 RepID=A0A9W8HYE2_9FUNG|nr:hypothetical protein H4R20_000884 [Coemansia guatemalensis]